MKYLDVIADNCVNNSPVNWWPRYAFHYTDVTNVVEILKTGFLFSRQVINLTSANTTSYVRFYFRPLTPTQYHNEGFKHSALRYCHDPNANVPVPVFLCLIWKQF